MSRALSLFVPLLSQRIQQHPINPVRQVAERGLGQVAKIQPLAKLGEAQLLADRQFSAWSK